MKVSTFNYPVERAASRGVSLVELLAFIVIISIALAIVLQVFSFQVSHSIDPAARITAMEKGQALLDEILSRKFADNTPSGGFPPCDPCASIGTGLGFDDVGDYHGYDDAAPLYRATVQVVEAGLELGLDSDEMARSITVTIEIPNDGGSFNLSAYRTNF